MLADRIMETCAAGELAALRALLPRMPRVDFTNVSDYLWATFRDEFAPARDVPNASPPWPSFWMETTAPAHFWVRSYGIAFSAYDLRVERGPRDAPEGARWFVRASAFAEDRASRAITSSPLSVADFAIDESGRIIDWAFRDLVPDGWECGDRPNTDILYPPALLALAFMHCKNVTTREVVPPEKLSKARERRKGIPLLRYHVLEIEPMKKVLRNEGAAESTGLKQALHICRGHFAEYGAAFGKGKMFGKHEGRFWVPMHARGNAAEGVVAKDYSVAAPKAVS